MPLPLLQLAPLSLVLVWQATNGLWINGTEQENQDGHFRTHRQIFLHSQMTPLLALVALLLGMFAVLVTPREEEPQINVTMANVLIAFPGRLRQGRGANRGDAGRAGAVADRRHRARLFGVAARHGGAHRAVQGRRGARAIAGQAV